MSPSRTPGPAVASAFSVVWMSRTLSAGRLSPTTRLSTGAVLGQLAGWSVAPVVVATQARVAIGDRVGEALGARIVMMLIGGRSGPSSAASLGLYLIWDPRTGRADSDRTCISNVRPPHGLGQEHAADPLAGLLFTSASFGASGVILEGEGVALRPGVG